MDSFTLFWWVALFIRNLHHNILLLSFPSFFFDFDLSIFLNFEEILSQFFNFLQVFQLATTFIRLVFLFLHPFWFKIYKILLEHFHRFLCIFDYHLWLFNSLYLLTFSLSICVFFHELWMMEDEHSYQQTHFKHCTSYQVAQYN